MRASKPQSIPVDQELIDLFANSPTAFECSEWSPRSPVDITFDGTDWAPTMPISSAAMPISSPTTPVSAGAGTSSMRQRSQSVPLPKKSVRFLPTETKGLVAERQLDSDQGVDDIDCPIDTWLNHVGRGWAAQYGTAFHQVAVHSVRDLVALPPNDWATLGLELENCGAKFVQFRRLVEAMERIPEFHGMDFCQLPQHTVPVNRVESPTFRGIPEGLPDIQGPLSPSSGRRRRPVRSWLSTI